uniref:intraflagellar transport protein 22 homolog isoform X2 n=1 Tax=Ciona intestinalis TaxID=7719 RepID=UPI000EF446C5|nr:intraflagellar transport protein 22 homolog isoform X2 [Ciona intestinalis]|eukprot:XP_026690527.1 intraflagellar transport protein 22 homolog isoform X2 [Ciona intestinalis]
MSKAKILLVGPCGVGKSVVANFLSDQTDILNSKYRPTIGVRILEFETSLGNSLNVDVELWDCSGSESFETCWPAMASQADGVIIVYDPLMKEPSPAVETLVNYFITSNGLKEMQCMLFANSKGRESTTVTSPLPSVLNYEVNLEKHPGEVMDNFKDFLKKVFNKLSASQEREELDIIN